MKIDFTEEIVFSFDGPNLCFLGTPYDFKTLSKYILPLTLPNSEVELQLDKETFVIYEERLIRISLLSKSGGSSMLINNDGILFSLSSRCWERLFKYFILMSWEPSTYYLNSDDSSIQDLEIIQDFNFICSSEW